MVMARPSSRCGPRRRPSVPPPRPSGPTSGRPGTWPRRPRRAGRGRARSRLPPREPDQNRAKRRLERHGARRRGVFRRVFGPEDGLGRGIGEDAVYDAAPHVGDAAHDTVNLGTLAVGVRYPLDHLSEGVAREPDGEEGQRGPPNGYIPMLCMTPLGSAIFAPIPRASRNARKSMAA
jgi:hypothetical protein